MVFLLASLVASCLTLTVPRARFTFAAARRLSVRMTSWSPSPRLTVTPAGSTGREQVQNGVCSTGFLFILKQMKRTRHTSINDNTSTTTAINGNSHRETKRQIVTAGLASDVRRFRSPPIYATLFVFVCGESDILLSLVADGGPTGHCELFVFVIHPFWAWTGFE